MIKEACLGPSPYPFWAPAILFWQFTVGVRTVEDGECYIQFFSNAAVTFGTAIAAFYLPVIIMIMLYWHISRASKSRIKKDKKEPVANQDPVSPSLVQGRIVKPKQQQHAWGVTMAWAQQNPEWQNS